MTTYGGAIATVGARLGQLCFEVNPTTISDSNTCFGVATSAATFANLSGSNGTGGAVIFKNGDIAINGTRVVTGSTALSAGTKVFVVIDFVHQKIYFKNGSGNYNNSGTANPATNTGGLDISVFYNQFLFPVAVVATGDSDSLTFNFGATSFTATVPSGFTSGFYNSITDFLGSDGFDFYYSAADIVEAGYVNNGMLNGYHPTDTPAGFVNGNAMLLYSWGGNLGYTFPSGSMLQGWVSFYVRSVPGSNNYAEFSLRPDSNFSNGADEHIRVAWNGGNISATANNGATSILASTAISDQSWQCISIEWLIDPTAGYVKIVQSDGTAGTVTTLANVTGVSTQVSGRPASVQSLRWFINSPGTRQWDHFVWGIGPALGDHIIQSIRPSAAGSHTDWTAAGGNTVVMDSTRTNTGGNTASLSANQCHYVQVTAPATGVINQAYFYMNNSLTGNIKVAFYAADGTGGQPGTLIGVSSAVNNPDNTRPYAAAFGTPLSVTQGTSYYFGIISDSAIVTKAYWTGGGGATGYSYYGTQSYSSPTNASGLFTSTTASFFLYDVVGTVTPVSQVSETIEDWDASYVGSVTAGDTSTFTLTSPALTVSTVYAVNVRLGVDAESAIATPSVAPVIRQSGTDVVGSNVSISTTWGFPGTVYGLNPVTKASWSPSDLSTAEVGFKRTA